jgi:ribosomal protein S18 acetylase RimI-like enzyme
MGIILDSISTISSMISGRIRVADGQDFEAILACNATSSIQNKQRIEQISVGIKGGQCLAWETDGLISGFVISTENAFFHSDFIDLVIVSTSMRRLGIGQQLLRAAAHASKNQRVWTSTNNSNIPMRGLLAEEGWKLSGALTGFDQSDDELVFYFDL